MYFYGNRLRSGGAGGGQRVKKRVDHLPVLLHTGTVKGKGGHFDGISEKSGGPPRGADGGTESPGGGYHPGGPDQGRQGADRIQHPFRRQRPYRPAGHPGGDRGGQRKADPAGAGRPEPGGLPHPGLRRGPEGLPHRAGQLFQRAGQRPGAPGDPGAVLRLLCARRVLPPVLHGADADCPRQGSGGGAGGRLRPGGEGERRHPL